jgi:hypothetical protein
MLLATVGTTGAQLSSPHDVRRPRDIGLFRDLAQISLPLSVQTIVTAGYHATGVGIARYCVTPRSGETAFRKQTADGRWFELLPDPAGVSPQQLGARGDYDRLRQIGSDDSQSFLDWVEYCMSRGGMRAWPGRLDGDYLITKNNALGLWKTHSGPVFDWQITGTGPGSCSLTFQPAAGADATCFFLYDGLGPSGTASSHNALTGLKLAGCELRLDARDIGEFDKVGWFRQSGWSVDPHPQQGWMFDQVFFRGDHARPSQMGAILEIVGTANGSENAFNLCRGYWWGHVIHCKNSQAVNHLSNFCHWELGVGDAFLFTRGGALTVVGGSIILDNHAAPSWESDKVYAAGATCWYDGRRYRALTSGTSGHAAPMHGIELATDGGVVWVFEADESMYLLRIGGDLKGQINNFALYGARIELRSCRAKLIDGGDLNTGSQILFSGVSVQAVTGGYRTSIVLKESALKIKFDSCYLAAPGGFSEPITVAFGSFDKDDASYVFRASSSPQLRLVNCWVSPAIHSLVAWEPCATGVFSIEDCYGVCPQATHGAELLFDCDMYNPVRPLTARGMPPRNLKSKLVNFSTYPGRHADAGGDVRTDCSFIMPPGAILKRIHIAKANRDGNRVPVVLALESGDGESASLYAIFSHAVFSDGFSLDSGDLMRVVAREHRALRIVDRSENVTGAAHPREAGDYLLVEYY